ncbi:MAG: hypothetical protein OJJ21_21950 [Ferrovibrio sp.]|uniref:hypothetical protein n=1 Tax=Ferrovibrio sp. TaxID=1917215 RepID=UPI002633E103|nr:hypothetical protein [Ferrovibrio sp.]MCW0236277.1 hypothetical protein [Ferrovibrio sp.]
MAKLASSGALIGWDGGKTFVPEPVDILIYGDLHACNRFIKGQIENLPSAAEVW